MFDFFEFLVNPVIHLFDAIYNADARPAARRMTVGCPLIVLCAIALLVTVYLVQRA